MKVGLGRHLVRSPGIAFGNVRTRTHGITAAVIVDRMMAGEPPELLAGDYGIPLAEVVACREWVHRLMSRERALKEQP